MSLKSFFYLFAFLLISVGLFGAGEAKAACAEPTPGGAIVISSSCAFDTTNTGGIQGSGSGGITINSGQSLTINAGQTIVWTPGSAVIVTGTLIINKPGGILRKTNLWIVDGDADGYPLNKILVAQDSSPGATYRARSVMTSYTTEDLDDNNDAVTTYAYSQSTYYAYSQGTYYAYSQGTYYAYSQGTYYSYSQSAYAPPNKTCVSISQSAYPTRDLTQTACTSYCSGFGGTLSGFTLASGNCRVTSLNWGNCTVGAMTCEEYAHFLNYRLDHSHFGGTCSCSG